jgi:nicotinamidase-related amidase
LNINKVHPHLLNRDAVLVMVVDMQEPFLRNIYDRENLIENVRLFLQVSKVMRLPVISTTQYLRRMGDIIPEIKEMLPPLSTPFDKLDFSCFRSPAVSSEVQRSGCKQILLCGVEAHICVSQTAHDLTAAGYQVHVLADAVSSRKEVNWRIGLDKMRQGGVLLSSVELAIYEMLEQAGTPEFKEIVQIVK